MRKFLGVPEFQNRCNFSLVLASTHLGSDHEYFIGAQSEFVGSNLASSVTVCQDSYFSI